MFFSSKVDKLEELYPDLCTTENKDVSDNRQSDPKLTPDEWNAQKMAAFVKKLGQTDRQLLIVVDAVNQVILRLTV